MAKIKTFDLEYNIEYVKIHGLQRTATNYFAHLIDNNYKKTKSLVNIGGWKHGHYCAPWVLGQEVHVLVATKNPYAWLLSLYKHLKPSIGFDSFVKNPLILGEPNGAPFLLRASNPVSHWNNMNFHWMSIKTNTKKVCMLPHEEMLIDPEGMICALGNYFELERVDILVNPSKSVQPSEENAIVGSNEFDKSYYFDKLYLEEYTPELLAFVNDQLDWKLMQDLRYEKEKK